MFWVSKVLLSDIVFISFDRIAPSILNPLPIPFLVHSKFFSFQILLIPNSIHSIFCSFHFRLIPFLAHFIFSSIHFSSFHIWLIPFSAHSRFCSFQSLLFSYLSYSISWSFHFWLILAYKKPNFSHHTNKLTSSWESLPFYKYCVSHFDHQFTWKRKILSLSNSIIRSILNRFLYQHFLNKINVQGHNRYMRPSNHNWMKSSLNSRSCFYA